MKNKLNNFLKKVFTSILKYDNINITTKLNDLIVKRSYLYKSIRSFNLVNNIIEKEWLICILVMILKK